MNSQNLKKLFWGFFILYCISFILPAARIFREVNYGYQAAIMGVFFYGLAILAHLSAIGGLFSILNQPKVITTSFNWSKISIGLAFLGTIFWPLIIYSQRNDLYIGYYVWAISTIGMAIVHLLYRIEQNK